MAKIDEPNIIQPSISYPRSRTYSKTNPKLFLTNYFMIGFWEMLKFDISFIICNGYMVLLGIISFFMLIRFPNSCIRLNILQTRLILKDLRTMNKSGIISEISIAFEEFSEIFMVFSNSFCDGAWFGTWIDDNV